MALKPHDPDAPVELARFLDVPQADFVVSVLAGSGIEAIVDAPHMGTIGAHYLLGAGGVRVLVRTRDRERALEVLESLADAGNDDLEGFNPD